MFQTLAVADLEADLDGLVVVEIDVRGDGVADAVARSASDAEGDDLVQLGDGVVDHGQRNVHGGCTRRKDDARGQGAVVRPARGDAGGRGEVDGDRGAGIAPSGDAEAAIAVALGGFGGGVVGGSHQKHDRLRVIPQGQREGGVVGAGIVVGTLGCNREGDRFGGFDQVVIDDGDKNGLGRLENGNGYRSAEGDVVRTDRGRSSEGIGHGEGAHLGGAAAGKGQNNTSHIL